MFLHITLLQRDQRIRKLDSSVALIQAASGLERLMAGTAPGILKDSTVAQISAFLYYDAMVLSKLTANDEFKNLFRTTIFNQIEKDFGNYVDAQARVKPRSLHHVYEWNKAGVPTARLFNLYTIGTNGLSFKINYNFKLSKSPVPSKNKKQKKKYVFANKADVMEAGMPIVIRPRSAERLVFEMDGETVFMPKGSSVAVGKPGGSQASHQFSLSYGRFFGGPLVNSSIKSSGLQRIFNSKITKALSLPMNIRKVQYSFSAGKIRLQADAALESAFGGSL
jgi:hypothetical protein